MAWVRGIRQVTEVLVQEPQERRGPQPEHMERLIQDLPAEAIARIVGPGVYTLPVHRGAGPCGTRLRRPCGGGWAMRWSTLYLVRPLALYYATYEPPLRFGAKSTPRGRRIA